MARIAGVDLPRNKRGVIGLTYIFGIGLSRSEEILEKAEVDIHTKVQDWSDDQLARIRNIISEEYKVEGELRSEVQMNIKGFILATLVITFRMDQIIAGVVINLLVLGHSCFAICGCR